MVAVVGELLPRLEAREAAYHSVRLDGGDMAILGAHHPLASLHGYGPVAFVPDGDEIDKGMWLVGRSGQVGGVHHPVDRGPESFQKTGLHGGWIRFAQAAGGAFGLTVEEM